MRGIEKTLDQYQAKAREKRSRDERRRELTDLRTVLSTKQGRRFLYRVLEKTHCFSSIFAPDASELAHNAGWQDSGFFLTAEMQEASLEFFYLMLKEGLTEKQNEAITLIEEAETLRKEAENRGEDVEN